MRRCTGRLSAVALREGGSPIIIRVLCTVPIIPHHNHRLRRRNIESRSDPHCRATGPVAVFRL